MYTKYSFDKSSYEFSYDEIRKLSKKELKTLNKKELFIKIINDDIFMNIFSNSGWSYCDYILSGLNVLLNKILLDKNFIFSITTNITYSVIQLNEYVNISDINKKMQLHCKKDSIQTFSFNCVKEIIDTLEIFDDFKFKKLINQSMTGAFYKMLNDFSDVDQQKNSVLTIPKYLKSD